MANVNIYDMADTWNNVGTTFTAIKMNVTDTASNAASLLMDLQVGGTSIVSVGKDGWINVSQSQKGIKFSTDNTFVSGNDSTIVNISNKIAIRSNTSVVEMVSNSAFGWGSSTGITGSIDTAIYRDAANTLALRNSTNQQTLRTYGTYTDASNYRRVVLTMTTAGVASLSAEGAGTGSSGNVLHISSLPTSNPGPGILWNNAGTPAIGT